MFINSRLGLFLLLPLLCTPQVSARQSPSPTSPGDGEIHLDVVVTRKSGPPVTGLQQQDFTLFDNKASQPITSFRAVDGRQAPIEVVIVVDAVNTGPQSVAYEREQIDKLLRVDGGHLAYPTSLAIFTDTGTPVQGNFSADGNALSAALEKYSIGLRDITRAAGFYGADERLQLSLKALNDIAAREASRPGRKIILWVSPGWPILSGPNVEISQKQQQHIFDYVVGLSSILARGHITLYSIDPLGSADAAGPRTFYWKSFLKGVSKPNQVLPGNLALEVIATQSGGVALSSSNDVAGLLRKCLADTGAYYELTFDPAIPDQPNEYHHLEIRLAQPGLTARTRQGYYSQIERAGRLTAQSSVPGWEDDAPGHKSAPESEPPGKTGEDSSHADAHPYFDEPFAKLVDRIPELKALQPAPDQEELPVILQKMGRKVDDFVRDIGDLIADEEVTQEKLNADGKIKSKERVQDEYLILHHGYEWGASSEYRMDETGNRLGPIGLEKGYLLTSGFALGCISFSTVAQAQSEFRLLGEENIDSRETYVLGFAQRPGAATFTTTIRGTGAADVHMLTQGILWVDKNSLQIIRMRTDLLTPSKEIRLDQDTTEVAFGEVKLPDVPDPLWLPSNVDVYMKIDERKFRNVHHYTNYRHYRVSVKIGAPQ
ncbi:MAG TPA: VWA domain-containing protein [Candidatus Acidoferrum sp.]|jgi:VWFA-related protein